MLRRVVLCAGILAAVAVGSPVERPGAMLAPSLLEEADPTGSPPLPVARDEESPAASMRFAEARSDVDEEEGNGEAGEDNQDTVSVGVDGEEEASMSVDSDGSGDDGSEEGDSISFAGKPIPAPSTTSASGPCGADTNPCHQAPAKIVAHLTPGAREFRPTSDPAQKAKLVLSEEDRNDHDDQELKELMEKLTKAEEALTGEREWVTRVYAVIDHYREKVARVQMSIRKHGGVIYELEQKIHKRQEDLKHEDLQSKLKNVHSAVAELEKKTDDVEQNRASLIGVREQVRSSIRRMKDEIRRLRATKVY